MMGAMVAVCNFNVVRGHARLCAHAYPSSHVIAFGYEDASARRMPMRV